MSHEGLAPAGNMGLLQHACSVAQFAPLLLPPAPVVVVVPAPPAPVVPVAPPAPVVPPPLHSARHLLKTHVPRVVVHILHAADVFAAQFWRQAVSVQPHPFVQEASDAQSVLHCESSALQFVSKQVWHIAFVEPVPVEHP